MTKVVCSLLYNVENDSEIFCFEIAIYDHHMANVCLYICRLAPELLRYVYHYFYTVQLYLIFLFNKNEHTLEALLV